MGELQSDFCKNLTDLSQIKSPLKACLISQISVHRMYQDCNIPVPYLTQTTWVWWLVQNFHYSEILKFSFIHIWVASWQNQQNGCAPIQVSDQPGHLPYADWADAQADLGFCCARMPFCWFCHEVAHIWFYEHLHGLVWVKEPYIKWARSCENVPYAICEQQRCRSACASTQSDQHFCFHCLDSVRCILAISKLSRV